MFRTRYAIRDTRYEGRGARHRWSAMLLGLVMVVSACGDDDATSTTTAQAPPTTEAAAFPVTVRGVEIPVAPERIVSLSATHTEVLYEIGAGPAVIGTDLFSDFPTAALDTEKVDAFNLSVEAVAELDPDLVILSFDPGDAVSGLEALGIPAILFSPPGPIQLSEVYDEWRDLGVATGNVSETEALIEEVDGDIQALVGLVPEAGTAPTFFVELDSTLFGVGSGTLIDSIFSLLGLENVADPADGPFPQFSAEALVAADPDYYFLADTVCCGESASTVAARPGFDALSAVGLDRVIELDDSVVSRWGPRLVELVRVIAKVVHGVG